MSETSEIGGDGGGVILKPPSSKGIQYKYWFFTFNNYLETDPETIETIFKSECKWFIFQEEIGEKCGTRHLQGTICLLKKQRLTELKRIDPKIRWESTKCVKSSIAYCTKKESRNGKQWHYGIDIPEPIEIEKPTGWQLDVIKIINQPVDKRKIYWFWERDGNIGKSELCKYLVVEKDALMVSGKANDAYHMISKFPKKRKLIVFDIPRSNLGYVSYGAIEQIKNGLVFSGKYDSCQIVFNRPHVIIFANEPPLCEEMSKDRWNIVEITKEMIERNNEMD